VQFEVRDVRPDPTLDLMVNEAQSGERRRLIVLSGEASAAPVQTGGIRITVSGGAPEQGEPAGFYVPGCDPLDPQAEATITGDVALAQLTVVPYESHEATYGVAGAETQLVADESQGGVRWPYLGFLCFGGRRMTIRYRVTLLQTGDPRAIKLLG
jgi:hypothetical protein